YWLSDAEWKRIEPLMPRGRRGAHRVDDRRVISGIMHMLRSVPRGRDCPPEYGPYTTVYNRFNRWSRQDGWTDIFYALTGSTARIGPMSTASTHIKSHDPAGASVECRSTARTSRPTVRRGAQKGGLPPRGRPLARRPHDKNPRADRGSWPPGRLFDHAPQMPRSAGRARSAADSPSAPAIAR